MPFKTGDCVKERYRLQRSLGSNGSRQTWLAEDLLNGRPVTFKSLYFGQDTQWQEFKLLEREVATLQSLDHPRIPSFVDAFWQEMAEGQYYCLVQGYIPGRSLAERVGGGERMEFEQVKHFVRSMLLVLEYLHRQSPPVVHRDIKPSNIVVGEDGEYYLIDFGAVRATDGQSRTITVVGTFGYAAMEQFAGRAAPASDLYGLGQTIVHLLTGKNPGDFAAEELELFLRYSFSLDSRFRTWLSKMIEPDVRNRFPSASEALVAFFETSKETSFSTKEKYLADNPNTREVTEQLSSRFIHLEIKQIELELKIPGCNIFTLDFDWLLIIIWKLIGLTVWSAGLYFSLLILVDAGPGAGLLIGLSYIMTFVAGSIAWIYTLDELREWLAPAFGFHLSIGRSGYRVRFFGFRSASSPDGLYPANELLNFKIKEKYGRSFCTLEYQWLFIDKSGRSYLQKGEYCFGSQLTRAEQEWLVEKMNSWLNQAKHYWG